MLIDGRTDGQTDGWTDGQKIGRLYRTLLQAGAIIMYTPVLLYKSGNGIGWLLIDSPSYMRPCITWSCIPLPCI